MTEIDDLNLLRRRGFSKREARALLETKSIGGGSSAGNAAVLTEAQTYTDTQVAAAVQIAYDTDGVPYLV